MDAADVILPSYAAPQAFFQISDPRASCPPFDPIEPTVLDPLLAADAAAASSAAVVARNLTSIQATLHVRTLAEKKLNGNFREAK